MKLYILLLGLIFSLYAHALSFKVDGICYSTLSESACRVTYDMGQYEGSIRIPQQVTYDGKDYDVVAIGKYAFRNTSALNSVTLPNTIEVIEENAFEASAIQSINFPEGLILIKDEAFMDCKNLHDITFPSTLDEIMGDVFYGCRSLGKVVISDSSTPLKVHRAAFSGKGITSLYIGRDFNDTDMQFYGNSRLKEVIIGRYCTKIYKQEFVDCTSLESVTIPDWVTELGEVAFSGCKAMKEVIIGSGITSIGINTFLDCIALENVVIGENVTTIATSAFDLVGAGGGGPRTLTIPNSVKSIDGWAFASWKNLENVKFGTGISRLGNFIFYGCSKIDSVYCYGETPARRSEGTANDIFNSSVLANAVLFVPSSAKEKYEQTSPWSRFKNIRAVGDSGINDVVIDSDDNKSMPVFFNLQGHQIPYELLTPGVYIKRQGNKTEKILIK